MDEDKVKSFWTWAIIGGAAILVAAIVVFTGKILWDVKPDVSSVVLPLVLIVGVLVLVTLLGLLTAVFSSLSLANPNEALGLPSGSVRAVIALMLILVFAVMAIFFYSSLAGVQANDVRVDIAKQLITLLGTLVTAVSSFYFGANVAAAAKKEAGTTQPSPSRVPTVSPLKRQDAEQDFVVTGENLAGTKTVKLVQGTVTVPTDLKSATATQVNCRVMMDSTKPAGKWDVIISDGGADTKLPVQADVT